MVIRNVNQKGTIQDATVITADPGHASTNTPRGDVAKTRRSHNGTWAMKGKKSYFGYKLHTKENCDFGLVRAVEVTTAAIHDSQNRPFERRRGGLPRPRIFRYQNKRFQRHHASECSRAADRCLRSSQKYSNLPDPITRGTPVCRHHSIRVTTVLRVHTKMLFSAFSFNLLQLAPLKNKEFSKRMHSTKN